LSPRQIFSAILLILIIAVIFYPTTATGTVRLNAKYQQAIIKTEIPGEAGPLIIRGVTNLYVSFSEVRIHLASEGKETGWLPISFGTSGIDLADLANRSGTIVMTPTVPVGEYDTIMLTFSNATAVVNGTTLQVESVPRLIVANYSFAVKSGSDTDLKLEFIADYRALNASRRVFFEVKPAFD